MAETVTTTDPRAPVQILVIADDFTGANDTGVALVEHGMAVCVRFDLTHCTKSEGDRRASIYSTDSRALNATEAAQSVRRVIQAALPTFSSRRWVFKKMDSTLRGNPGAETEAALMALDCPLAIVATAVPDLGRVVIEGLCYVNGCLLTDTEFGTDPKTPVNTASVGKRLAEQTALRQHHVSLHALRANDFQTQLTALVDAGIRIVIADSQTSEDLARLVQAAETLPFRPLLVGASGLSQALASHCLSGIKTSTPFEVRRPAPVLAVVGSMSEAAAGQIAFALQHRSAALINIDVLMLFTDRATQWLTQLSTQICSAIEKGRHCIVSTCQNTDQRQYVAQFCQQNQISRQHMGNSIATFIGQLIQHVFQKIETRPGGVYLSGGDIALAVARALGATGFEIKGQIAGCVPWGYLQESQIECLPVMTKAGGFGHENTLLEVLRCVEEKLSD